jgi:oligopeptide transport system substrate-binding protein
VPGAVNDSQMNYRTPTTLLATLLATLLGLSGCTEGTQEHPVQRGPVDVHTMHRGNGSEPKTLDMANVDETVGSTILFELYEGLTSTDADAQLTAGVAYRWDISEDGIVYTFHLREDSRWSTGEPVVAEDFVASFRRYVTPAVASPNAQFFYPIKNARAVLGGELPPEALGVLALDDRKLRITLEQPTPWLLQMFATRLGYPVYRPALETHGNKFAKPGTLVGNGAYELKEWVVQSHILIERNPHYWNADSVEVERVYYYPTEDLSSEFMRYRSGELHYTRDIPNQQFRWINRNLAEHLQSGPYLGVFFMPIDLSEPPFDDVRVRKALSMTVDRRIIAEKITGTSEVPADGLVPSYVSDYPETGYDWLDWPMEERIAEARRLYAEAGFSGDNPLRFTIHYNTNQNNKRIVLALSAMWKQALGAYISILNQEWKVYLQTRKFRGQWDMIRMGWIAGWDDPYSFLEVLISDSDFNDPGFNDPEYDRLLRDANTTTDPARRAAILAEAETRMLEQYPVIPLFYYATNRLVRPEVDRYRINIVDRDPTRLYGLGLAP